MTLGDSASVGRVELPRGDFQDPAVKIHLLFLFLNAWIDLDGGSQGFHKAGGTARKVDIRLVLSKGQGIRQRGENNKRDADSSGQMSRFLFHRITPQPELQGFRSYP